LVAPLGFRKAGGPSQVLRRGDHYAGTGK